MKVSLFIEQVFENFQDGMVTIETNEDTYTIEDGENFVNGIEGTFMCDALGNIVYPNLGEVAIKLFVWLEETGQKIIDIYTN